jgi:hypothetical protein
MIRALQLLAALARRRADVFGVHAKTRATHIALLGAFATAAAGYLVALATVALSRWLGVMPALAILAGICLVGCLGVLIAMRAERRKHAAAAALQAQDEQRMMQAALVGALPALRRGGLLTAAVAGVGLLLATRRGRGRPTDD